MKAVARFISCCVCTWTLFGCGDSPDTPEVGATPESPDGGVSSDLRETLGEEHLTPIMVSESELTVYEDKELTEPIGVVAPNVFVTVDDIIRGHGDEHTHVHITSPEGLTGYADLSQLNDVRSVCATKLNIRDEHSLSGRVIATAERGESVVFLDGQRLPHNLAGKDGYTWRESWVNGRTGWLASEYIIEKRFFDVLEPALLRYESGDISGMQSYLEEISARYSDVESSLAPDGKTATVTFRFFEQEMWGTIYIVGEPDMMVYASSVYDSCISPGGDYTYVNYDYLGYGYTCGNEPVIVINNRSGEEAYHGRTFLGAFGGGYDDTTYHLNREFVDDRYLLLVTYGDFTDEEFEYSYLGFSGLTMIDLFTGISTVLLEPDMNTVDIDTRGVKLKRIAEFDPSSDAVRRAMETELFRRCVETGVYCFISEA